jgi:hypothetical protein
MSKSQRTRRMPIEKIVDKYGLAGMHPAPELRLCKESHPKTKAVRCD